MKNKATIAVKETATTLAPEATASVTPVLATTASGKSPGRPVMIDSKRQKEMLQREIRRQAGGLKKGRPSNPDSNRQQKEREKAEKRAAGLLNPGRPKYTPEQKAAADALKAQRKADEKARIEAAAKELIATGKVDELLSTTETPVTE